VFGAVVPAERGEEGSKGGVRMNNPQEDRADQNPGPALEIGQGRGAALARARCRFPAVHAKTRKRAATATHGNPRHRPTQQTTMTQHWEIIPHDGRSYRTHGRSCRTHGRRFARRSKCVARRLTVGHKNTESVRWAKFMLRPAGRLNDLRVWLPPERNHAGRLGGLKLGGVDRRGPHPGDNER